jgi:hypothetical protein
MEASIQSIMAERARPQRIENDFTRVDDSIVSSFTSCPREPWARQGYSAIAGWNTNEIECFFPYVKPCNIPKSFLQGWNEPVETPEAWESPLTNALMAPYPFSQVIGDGLTMPVTGNVPLV